MGEGKIININGKKIDYTKLSDDDIVKLYKQLKLKQQKLYKRIMDYDKGIN